MTSTTCDVGTQTSYPSVPMVVAPNVAVTYDEQTMNPRPFMVSNGAIFSPNKSEAAFALSSLFHGSGGEDCSHHTPPVAMTNNYDNGTTMTMTSPRSTPTAAMTYSNNSAPTSNCMEYAYSHNCNVDAYRGFPFSAANNVTTTPTNYCHLHHSQPPGQINHNHHHAPWGTPCCCHHPQYLQPQNQTNSVNSTHCHANNPNINNSIGSTWEPLPSRVSPGQYHNMSDDQRSFSKWNPQPESAMMPPTPTNQWGQTRPSFASKNPMDVILEAARFAPSPVLSTTCAFRAEDDSSSSTGKRLRDISNDQSLVTPTPTPKEKKARVDTTEDTSSRTYSRKNKSLGVLAETFVRKYEGTPVGTNIVIDDTAIEFQVERRRIYDIIAILESLEFITRRHKNTYSWNGRFRLNQLLGRLQAEAIATWPNVAKRAGLVNSNTAVAAATYQGVSEIQEPKSLGRLTQTYLKLFLVGHKPLSLPDASDIMHGDALDGDAALNSSDALSKATVNRMLKTRIRRLYDIANCACRIGFLRKVDGDDSRRPKFAWAYSLSPLKIKQLFDSTDSSRGNIDEGVKVADQPAAQFLQEEDDDDVDVDDASSGKASPPPVEDRLFLAQIHQRGAEDNQCAKPKAISWNKSISNNGKAAFQQPHVVVRPTKNACADHRQDASATLVRHRGATVWENGNSTTQPKQARKKKSHQNGDDFSCMI